MTTVGAPHDPACSAPFTTLHLDPHGVARMCGENKLHRVGRVPDDTLADIWASVAVEQLRGAVARHDFGMGCGGCRSGIESGRRWSVRAGDYDHLDLDDRAPRQPVRLELELSNRCNLACVMCNGDLSSTIRTQREGRPPLPTVYGDAFFDEFEALIPTLSEVTFLGGEPFLGREPIRALELLATHRFRGMCHVTTNGTVLNDRVRRLFDQLRINVAVSMDGHETSTFERIRVGADHAAVVRNVGWFRAEATRRDTTMVLHYCLMRDNWRELRPFLTWSDGLDVDTVVIPVMHPLDRSIDRMEATELTGLVDELARHDEDADRPLGRNRNGWGHTLDRLRGVADAAAVAVSAESLLGPASLARRAVLALTALVSLGDWADERGTSEFVLEASGCVAVVNPDAGDVLGIDLSAVVGCQMSDIMGPVTAHFGAFSSSSVLESPAGSELRSIEFEGPSGWTTVRSLHVEASPGTAARVHVGARRGQEGDRP